MNKMPMCRICLVENVRMYIVNDKELQELYGTLTSNPFVTEDRRPMLACFLCFAKLKQCCQLQRKCLEAEELFAQMMNEPNASVNRGQLEYSSGLTVTPVENISIVDVGHIENIAVKEELPAVCERLDDVVEPEEEHQSDDLEMEYLSNSYSDVEDVTAQQSQSELGDGAPLMEIKTEVEEEQELSRKQRQASDTTRAAVAKKQKLLIREKKLEDVITENEKKNEELDTKVTQNTSNCTFKLIPKFIVPLTNTTPRVNISVIDTTVNANFPINVKQRNSMKHITVSSPVCREKPFKCDICQSFFSRKDVLTQHIRTHTGEKPYKCGVCQSCFTQKHHLTEHIRTHTGEKPYKCEICQLRFSQKSHLTEHINTHTGEKPYKCEECHFCFSQKSILTRHLRTHTGGKPYKCVECPRRFSKKGSLTSHIRTHAGEKPFKCEECGLCFNQKIVLTSHIRTHTTSEECEYNI